MGAHKAEVCLPNEPHSQARGEVALWRGVLHQAMLDAASKDSDRLSVSRKHEAVAARESSKRWLQRPNKDFETVCLLADLNPDWVRMKVRAALEGGEL